MSIDIETKALKLIPVTPIHIGARDNGSNPLTIKDKKYVYFINDTKWGEYLKSKGILRDYVTFVSQWIHRNIEGISKERVPSYELWNIPIQETPIYKWVKNNILKTFLIYKCNIEPNDIIKFLEDKGLIEEKELLLSNKFILDASGNSYIPGSSIKGAIRTAIAWKMIKSKLNLDVYVEKSLRINSDKWNDNNRGNFFKELNKNIFENHNITYEGKSISNEKALTDFMKCLTVIDSENLSAVNETVYVYKLEDDVLVEKTNTIKQVYKNDENGQLLKIQLNRTLLSNFDQSNHIKYKIPFSSIDEILNITNEYYINVWQNEKSFSNKIGFYNSETAANFRLGYGSGMMSVALFTLLNNENRRAIRNLIKNRGTQIAPKSRRLVKDEEGNLIPMGWANLIDGETNA